MEKRLEVNSPGAWILLFDPKSTGAFSDQENLLPKSFVDEQIERGNVLALGGGFRGSWRMFVDEAGDSEVLSKAKRISEPVLLRLTEGKLFSRGVTEVDWVGKDWGRPPAYTVENESEEAAGLPLGSFRATVYEIDSEFEAKEQLIEEALGKSTYRKWKWGSVAIGVLWLIYSYHEKVIRWKWPDYPELPWYLDTALFFLFVGLTYYIGKWIGFRAAKGERQQVERQLKDRFARVLLVLERVPEGMESGMKGARLLLSQQ